MTRYLATAVLVATLSSSAAAEPRLQWQEHWPRFAWWEYAVTGAAVGVFAYAEWGTEPASSPRWSGPILFDEPFRDLLVLGTRQAREGANRASDVFWGFSWSFPVVDTLLVSLVLDRNLDVTWQLMMMGVEVYAVTSMITRLFHKVARRERPLKQACARDKSYDAACWDTPVSFFSGHTALAAASAGLTCVNHSFLPLYGGGWPDRLACATSITTASLTGLMRVMSDRHYMTDVLLGGALGFLTGYFLPRLIHYRHRSSGIHTAVLPQASEDHLGLAVTGLF